MKPYFKFDNYFYKLIKFHGVFGIKIPGFTKRMKETKAEIIIGSSIMQACLHIIPHGIPMPLKKAPNPLPSVGFFRKGSILGSSWASPTGLASAMLFCNIVNCIITVPASGSLAELSLI